MRKRCNKVKTGFNLNIALLVLIPIILIGTTLAKYFDEKQFKSEYQSNEFYFKSDLLSDSSEVPEYIFSEGTKTIGFYLKNNDDNLRYSGVDIDYTVSVTKDGETIETKNDTLAKNVKEMEKIEFTDLESGEYIVTAKATSPYEKTLSAKFILTEKDENIQYQISNAENNPVIELTVETKDFGGNIIISYPEGVVPDNTDSKLITAESNNMTTKLVENSVYTFKFFKKNPAEVYTQEDFSITKDI